MALLIKESSVLTHCEPQTLLSPPSNANPPFAKEDDKMGQFQNPTLSQNSLKSWLFMPSEFTYASPHSPAGQQVEWNNNNNRATAMKMAEYVQKCNLPFQTMKRTSALFIPKPWAWLMFMFKQGWSWLPIRQLLNQMFCSTLNATACTGARM